MKYLLHFIDRHRLGCILIILFIPSLLLVRDQSFTISPQTLAQAASQFQVSYQDQPGSFTIEPQNARTDMALIFYPGALVDSRAYAPKLSAFAQVSGVRVFIVKPLLRLADLQPNLAGAIIKAHPTITKWYIGGHSMGGGAACHFNFRQPQSIKGLILFASYCSAQDQQFSGRTLAVVGTHDPLEPLAKVHDRLPKNTTIVSIEGANHASFGDYGSQPFDGRSTISTTSMTTQLTSALQAFIQ